MKTRYFVYCGIAGVGAILLLNLIAQGNLIYIGELGCYVLAPLCGIICTDYWLIGKMRENGVNLRQLLNWVGIFSWFAAVIIAYGIGCALSGFVIGGFIYYVMKNFMVRLQTR